MSKDENKIEMIQNEQTSGLGESRVAINNIFVSIIHTSVTMAYIACVCAYL